jgi:hypothetical protein
MIRKAPVTAVLAKSASEHHLLSHSSPPQRADVQTHRAGHRVGALARRRPWAADFDISPADPAAQGGAGSSPVVRLSRHDRQSPPMRTTGSVVKDGRWRRCDGRSSRPAIVQYWCGCCTLVLHTNTLTRNTRQAPGPGGGGRCRLVPRQATLPAGIWRVPGTQADLDGQVTEC